MYFSSRRQQFLINQGYSFRVLANSAELISDSTEVEVKSFPNKKAELAMLAKIKAADDQKGLLEKTKADPDEVQATKARSTNNTSLTALSGGDSGLMYNEYSAKKKARGNTSRHPLFKNRFK
jgi:DNA excision repair protein ERCC-3